MFLAVCLSGPIRVKGKIAFVLFPFYPNQCIFFGGPPLGGLLVNAVNLSHLLEAGLD